MFFLFRMTAPGQDYRQNSKECNQHINYIKYMFSGSQEHDIRLDNLGMAVIKVVICDLGGSKPATCKNVKVSIMTFWPLWRQFRNVLDSQEYVKKTCKVSFMLDMLFLFRMTAPGQDYRQNPKECNQHINYIKYMFLESQEYEPKTCRVSFNLASFFFRMTSGQDYQHNPKECNQHASPYCRFA